ncbi:MAG TPA: RagB/SusD family nutrient uptake outer membrane protein [Cytophagales bacterium]|nr:RagB/SusD family nutrient uptake outer membrane protein [Cytophagales bacterium]
MKNTYNFLLAVVLLFCTLACKDDDLQTQDSTNDPEVVVKQVGESLAGQANLNSFIGAFESLELSSQDIEEGITIFAPLDDALQVGFVFPENARISETDSITLTPEILKNHIVKGIIKTMDLANGATLTTLSGKQLNVEVNGSEIKVNGVLISGKDVATGQKHVVHTVSELFDMEGEQGNSGVIDVIIWNSTKWTPEKPKGEKEAGVTVSLYNSKEDYAQGIVAHTKVTDADGKVIFTELEPEKVYYIEAKKDGLSNIFYKSAQTENGVYTGMNPDGLFQSQEEVSSHALQSDGMPGNFRWKDMNGDGKIDNSDKVAVPTKEVETINSETVLVEIAIGYNDNQAMGPIQSGEIALQLLNDSYQKLNSWQKSLVMVDGILSDDADCANMNAWCDIDNFSFNATNATFTALWLNGYKNIGQLNKLIRDVPQLDFVEKAEVMAQAKGMRAYIYLQLLTYFGDLPLQTGLELDNNVSMSSSAEVYDYIIGDLEGAASDLPMTWSSEKSHQLSGGAVKALIAKAALWKKDYQKAAEYSNQVLQSGSYQLMGSSSEVFSQSNNAEIIWDFSFSLSSSFSSYFYGRSFCPALRLTEVYLINAEAQFMLGSTEAGLNNLNIIRGRNELPVTNSSQELDATWKVAMGKEGARFSNLLRWQKAMEVLSLKGFAQHHALLPVPQLFLDNYPNLFQNPGY